MLGPVQLSVNNVYGQPGDTVFLHTPCATTHEGSSGNFIISYTVGEMVLVNTWQQSGFMFTQGILEPELPPVDSAYSGFYSSEISVFPNPASDVVQVRFALFQKGKFYTRLFDVTERLLQQNEFDYAAFATKQYNLSGYANSVYYLEITFIPDGGDNKKKQTFPVIKIK